MPRTTTKIENNTFVKGLITEASPLTFPENASLVDENFVLNRDGSRQRRAGMQYERPVASHLVSSLEGTTDSVNSYLWESVENDGDLDIAVIQIANKLYFFDNNSQRLMDNKLNNGNALTISGKKDVVYNFTDSYGKLIVATGDIEVTVLTYNSSTDVVSEAVSGGYRLEIRDTFGVEESPDIEIDNRPITLSSTHNYNLRNQGWPFTYDCISHPKGDQNPVFTDPVVFSGLFLSQPDTLNTDLNQYPSNADTITALKTLVFQNPRSAGAFAPREMKRNVFGTTLAARGHYLLDLFSRGEGRMSKSGIGTQTQDLTTGGVVSVASYAGRVFYSLSASGTSGLDDNSPDLGSMVMFSQSTTNIADLKKCYSNNDPTAPVVNNPIDTDGGFIVLSDAGTIFDLVPLGSSLFIFASKGVWQISGGDGFFSATNQSVVKITDFGAISPSSIVPGESAISFWAEGGIYLLQLDSQTLTASVQNITQTTIQSYYDNIPAAAKKNAVGIFDEITKQIRWLFQSESLAYMGYFTTELIFDTNLSAFYVSEIKPSDVIVGTSPYVSGYLKLSNVVFSSEVAGVVVGVDDVVAGVDDVVVTLRLSDQTTESATKYFTLRDLGLGTTELFVSAYTNLDYVDWVDEQNVDLTFGADANATLLTGYTTDGAAEVEKKSKFVTVFMKRTEVGFTDNGSGDLTFVDPSSCTMTAVWEWTNTDQSGRWSNPREIYRLPRALLPVDVSSTFDDYGFTVIKSKNKIRGKGSSLSLLFKTAPGHNLHLYGWTREVTVPEQ